MRRSLHRHFRRRTTRYSNRAEHRLRARNMRTGLYHRSRRRRLHFRVDPNSQQNLHSRMDRFGIGLCCCHDDDHRGRGSGQAFCGAADWTVGEDVGGRPDFHHLRSGCCGRLECPLYVHRFGCTAPADLRLTVSLAGPPA